MRRHRAALIAWCSLGSNDQDHIATATADAIETATIELRRGRFPRDDDDAARRLREIVGTRPRVAEAAEAVQDAGHGVTAQRVREFIEHAVVPRLGSADATLYRRLHAQDDIDVAAGVPDDQIVELRRKLCSDYAARTEFGDDASLLLQILLIPELWERMRRALAVDDDRHRRWAGPYRGRRGCGRIAALVLTPLLVLGVLLAIGPTTPVTGHPLAAPGGVAQGSISASVAHTRPLLGDPQVPQFGRRVTTDIAIRIEPASFRPGDTVALAVQLTFGFPIVDYRADGSVRCGDLDFGANGGEFAVGVGGELPGLPAPLSPDQIQLGLYPLAGQPREGPPVGTPLVFVGRLTKTDPLSRSTTPDKCTQTDINGFSGTITIPADGRLPPGGYLATPVAVGFHDITGVGGVDLTPEEVDGRIGARLPVVTVIG